MSLSSGLRVRKDMEAPNRNEGDDEEAAYLLTPAPNRHGPSQAKRPRRRRAFTTCHLSLRTLIFLLLIVFFASVAGLLISRSVYVVPGGSLFLLLISVLSSLSLQPAKCVDTPDKGYQCQPLISQYWGQYSPFFSVPSEIPDVLPPDCNITFAQVLSRHGARDPTASKAKIYSSTIQKLQANVKRFSGKYAFLNSFTYTLGADQLTVFGEREMINSGIAFYDRFTKLANQAIPFVRASGQERVVKSAQNFTQGFHQARSSGKQADASFPYPILSIPEGDGFNNTYVGSRDRNNFSTCVVDYASSLNHALCTEFENNETYNTIGSKAQRTFLATFLPSITARLNADLVKANLTAADTISLMDLCPFTTVASPFGTISPFCSLFTKDEWHHYDYYQTLGKYYGYGPGNLLGPTQGVGYANELIARMTGKPVDDHTTVNHTLDGSTETFPLNDALYVDVSHDNDMTAIFSAMKLYDSPIPLSKTFSDHRERSKGYSAAWTVPFAGRAYFEKMKCRGKKEELIRIVVNGRVLPLETCGGDALGRCTLSKFIRSLNFATEGGRWDLCFSS
ncbi:MAG: hypothetical protein LQ346_006355 [Caloplaca aetnensis]|nr:MAG: hypothetical protein LQ346_006355 [Caloplaca aetnensis]